MAELERRSGSDNSDNAQVFMSGSLKTNGTVCEVTLSNSHFFWKVRNQKVSIPLNLLITANDPKQMAPDSFTIVYVDNPNLTSLEKTEKWKISKNTFRCSDSITCTSWKDAIQERLLQPDLQRPKKLLVFLCPNSGNRNGITTYEKYAVPLFSLAGVKIHFIVTERPNHAQEVLDTYDLTTIDGIVAVGGDGTYQECISGLFRRTLKDRGLEPSEVKKDVLMEQTPVRVGMIPAGTGNGLAPAVSGSMDPETCVLHIILGFSKPIDVSTIHEKDGSLVDFSILLVGNGFLADVIAETEKHRKDLKKLRYPFCIFKVLANKQHMIHIEADLLCDAESSKSRLEKVNGDYFGTFIPMFLHENADGSNFSQSVGSIPATIFYKDIGIFKFAKMMYRIFKGQENWRELDFIDYYENIKECRIKWETKTESAEVEERDVILNIDGEIKTPKQPEIIIVAHKQVLQTFGRKVGW